MPEPIYEATADECRVATDWHGGQGSMFYAVSSTGSLSRGTMRPYGDDAPMSDTEWSYDLVSRLGAELREDIPHAVANDDLEGSEDAETMREWLAKVDALQERLETELGL